MNGVAGERALEAYVEEVRALLGGLDPDEVAELTDGLAGDLADAVHDTHEGGPLDRESLVARFGTPESYARELCTAAGLPFGGSPAPGGRRLRGRVRPAVRAVRGWWVARPSWVRDLAPVWWVARGWILFQVVLQLGSAGRYLGPQNREALPWSGLLRLALLATVVASVAFGIARRRAGDRRPVRWASTAVSVFAVLAAVPVVQAVSGASGEMYWAATNMQVRYVDSAGNTPTRPADGVVVDGVQVSNLFAYDADGKPLTGVQIYDDRGRPVETVSMSVHALQPYGLQLPGVDEPWTFYPVQDADGRSRWNVYPLSGAPESAIDYTGDPVGSMLPLVDGEQLRQPPRPFAQAPAVELISQDHTPSQDQTPSPEAEETATSTVTADSPSDS